MKNIKKVLSLSLVCLMFILAACSSNSETISTGKNENSEEPIVLTFNNTSPSTHHISVNGVIPWAKLVEEKTNGRIKIEVYHGSSLGGNRTVYDDVVGGTYDIGITGANYLYDTDFFPWSIADLPFIYTEPVQTQRIVTKVVEKFAVDGVNQQVKYLTHAAKDPYILVSTKPVNTIDDVKGMNISVGSRLPATMVKTWGATPVSFESTEIYEALHRGSADAVIYSGVSAGKHGYKFNEVAPYFVSNLSITNGTIPIFMNKDKWDSIPEDLKEIFEAELAPALGEMISKSYSNLMKSNEQEMENDATFIKLSEEELEKFTKAGIVAWDEWIKLAEERGFPGEEMISYLIQVLEEEGINVDFAKKYK